MNRSYVAAFALALALVGCHGSPAGLPPTLPAASMIAPQWEAHAGGTTVKLLIPPGSPNAAGMAGTFYSSWSGTGTPVATFAANVSARNTQCKTAQSTRTCTIPISVKAGGPYALFVSLYNVAPVHGKFPGGKLVGGGVLAVTVSARISTQIALTASSRLGATAIAVEPRGIHAIDSATVRAIVTGYNLTNDAIVSNNFTSAKGPATIAVSADKSSAPVLTFSTHDVAVPSKGTLTIAYTSSKATAVQAAGFVATLTATPNASGITVGKTTLTAAKPVSTLATLPQATSYPYVIVAGPDGNMWFTEFNAGRVSRINTSLRGLKEISGFAHPQSLAIGGDGAIWTADDDGNSAIGRITTAGVAKLYALPVNTYPAGISYAPNNKLWFGGVNTNNINTVATTGVFGNPVALPAPNSYPLFSVWGADRNQYFVLNGSRQIAQVTQAGAITHYYTIPGAKPSPQFIIVGPDRNLWFNDTNQQAIFRFETAKGTFTKVPVSTFYGVGDTLAVGPDGKIWFPTLKCNAGRLDVTTLKITYFELGKACALFGIALGPDGALYFTDDSPAAIRRLQ